MISASTTFSLISAALAIVRFLVNYLDKQKWIDAGAAAAMNKALQDSDNAITRARQARQSVVINDARDPASVLRDDDGFRRPDD